MNVFMGKVKRMSEYIAMVLFFVAAFFSLLYYIGNFDSDFMPVIGNLFMMTLQLGIWLVIPLCIMMKRRSYARYATLAVSLYWLITTLFSLLSDTSMAVGGMPSLVVAVGVFSFLTACALIVMTVFALYAVTRKSGKIKMIAACIYVGALLFYIVLFSLRVALAAKWNQGWNAYSALICNDLLIPFAMFFIAVAFGFREEEFVLPCRKKAVLAVETAPVPSVEPTPAPVEAEPVKADDTSVVEEPVEETPAEEPVPETPVEEIATEAVADELPAEEVVTESSTPEAPAEEDKPSDAE